MKKDILKKVLRHNFHTPITTKALARRQKIVKQKGKKSYFIRIRSTNWTFHDVASYKGDYQMTE